MISSLASKFASYRRAGVLFLFTLATLAYGCGSSTRTVSESAGKNPAKKLTEDQLYTYEGTGAAKRKVPISRAERVKLLRETANKGE